MTCKHLYVLHDSIALLNSMLSNRHNNNTNNNNHNRRRPIKIGVDRTHHMGHDILLRALNTDIDYHLVEFVFVFYIVILYSAQ